LIYQQYGSYIFNASTRWKIRLACLSDKMVPPIQSLQNKANIASSIIVLGRSGGIPYFCAMRSIASVEEQFLNELTQLYDAGEARQLYFLLLEDQWGWSKHEYFLRKQELIDDVRINGLLEALSSLKRAEPIQYVLGSAWFRGMKLIVDPSVLIPRPETEELVQLIIDQQQLIESGCPSIIDIGTGSGCIAIALKSALPCAILYALDISKDALQVAKQNADNHGMSIEYLQADILEWDVIFQADQQFDIVVSNPPYITEQERREMHPNVLAHEPHLALFVDNHTPLLFYEHISAFALKHLRPGGKLYFEINRNYGLEVCDLLRKKGFTDVQLHQDLQGADRIIQARKSYLCNDENITH